MPEKLEHRLNGRRSGVDRRQGERRVRDIPVAIECRMGGDRRSELERRSGVDRRAIRRDYPHRARNTPQAPLTAAPSTPHGSSASTTSPVPDRRPPNAETGNVAIQLSKAGSARAAPEIRN